MSREFDNLDYSYADQASIQLKRLQKINEQEPESIPFEDHRLFKNNPFDDLKSKDKNCLELQLFQALTTLGNFIYKKNSISVVNRKHKHNYIFGRDGVIRLKPKDKIKLTVCSRKRSSLMLLIVAKIINLLEHDGYLSNRQLFYQTASLCGASSLQFNRTLDDLCCLLGCSRVHLRILCQPKGLVYGNLKFKLKNDKWFDCLSSNSGTIIPTPEVPIVEIVSNAECIIIIEKDSVLQEIIKQEASTGFVQTYKVILFTARGYPDINSRAFLNKLWLCLKIPIFALTDADPHGLEIACCYKFGCYQTASEVSHLAIPQIRWLGLLPSDVEKQPIPESSKMNLTSCDNEKLISLSNRPYLAGRTDWLGQLNLMREMGKKAELESIELAGDYLTRTFLPNKLRYASWL